MYMYRKLIRYFRVQVACKRVQSEEMTLFPLRTEFASTLFETAAILTHKPPSRRWTAPVIIYFRVWRILGQLDSATTAYCLLIMLTVCATCKS